MNPLLPFLMLALGNFAGYGIAQTRGDRFAHAYKNEMTAYRRGVQHGTALFNTPKELEGSE